MNAGITTTKRLNPPVWNAHLLRDGMVLYAVTRLPEGWETAVGSGMRPGIGTLIFEGGGFVATEIFELEQAGFIRQVGTRRGMDIEITDKVYRQELEDTWDREHPELLTEHRRLQLRPEVFGRLTPRAPIYRVMPRRGVQGLGPGRLFTPEYLNDDPAKAAETAAFLFKDGAVQQVGVIDPDGRPQIWDEKDYKSAPLSRKVVDIDLSKIRGGISHGSPVFRVKKPYRGLPAGEIVDLSAVSFPPEVDGVEALKAAVTELQENGTLERLGVVGTDRGATVVLPATDRPPDYLGEEPFMTAEMLRNYVDCGPDRRGKGAYNFR